MENRKRSSNWSIFNLRSVWFGLIYIHLSFSGLAYADDLVDILPRTVSVSTNFNSDVQFYEITNSRITGNVCGPDSDWPCMESAGCLVIENFKKKE
jgi:hypothetical protein